MKLTGNDAIFELGIAAQQAIRPSTLPLPPGVAKFLVKYLHGLDISTQGHPVSHMQQAENDIWYKIRSYNCDMLLKLYNTLESTPEVKWFGKYDGSLINCIHQQ